MEETGEPDHDRKETYDDGVIDDENFVPLNEREVQEAEKQEEEDTLLRSPLSSVFSLSSCAATATANSPTAAAAAAAAVDCGGGDDVISPSCRSSRSPGALATNRLPEE